MPHPYVSSATIKAGIIEVTVELDYADSGSYFEVSGSATQTGGAYANFYVVADATSGLTGPTGPYPSINVSAHPLPPNNFTMDEDITFVIRVAKVWLTVLGLKGSVTSNTSGTSAPDGTKWDVVKKESHITDGFSDDPAGSPPGTASQ